LVPRPDSLSLANEIDINNTCNILPNPAKNNIKIISQFKVKDIEIYNISGIKLKTIPINDYEKYIDISDLIQGTYIIKINTPRGIATKKLLVE
jgi:flagellar hook assembly protein FlgD